MRWINKRNKRNRKRAHYLLNRFLNKGWNEVEQKYVNCDFDAFKVMNVGRRIKAILYSEQDGYCCYCMRKLNLNEKSRCTIEHVMPHKVNKNDIAFYFANVPNLKKYVRFLLINDKSRHLRSIRPYPHFCAYENLVLSCSGAVYQTDEPEKELLSRIHVCCNNVRGRERVYPIFFYRNISIGYEKDGHITCPKKYERTIEILGLETDNLCLFRKAWAYLLVHHSIDEVKLALDDEKLREEILMDTPLKINEVKRLNLRLYWATLYDYRWFGLYFQKQVKM